MMKFPRDSWGFWWGTSDWLLWVILRQSSLTKMTFCSCSHCTLQLSCTVVYTHLYSDSLILNYVLCVSSCAVPHVISIPSWFSPFQLPQLLQTSTSIIFSNGETGGRESTGEWVFINSNMAWNFVSAPFSQLHHNDCCSKRPKIKY